VRHCLNNILLLFDLQGICDSAIHKEARVLLVAYPIRDCANCALMGVYYLIKLKMSLYNIPKVKKNTDQEDWTQVVEQLVFLTDEKNWSTISYLGAD